MNDIRKIIKSLEESNLLIKHKAKEQKGGFLGILWRTLGDNL